MAEPLRYFAPRAWLATGWADDVLLEVDARGHWARIQPGADAAARAGAVALEGPVLPGLVNGHSHAFQRAIAGLTERCGPDEDDFWRWRDRMYAAALRISPEQLEAIAVGLYAELLSAGYTQVCEFHYLHRAPDGQAYADPAEMSLALVRAARRVGIGLTLLPTLYMRSGFGASGLRDDQRRFASTPESVLGIARAVRAAAPDDARITAGLALHSLRAVDEGALREAAAAAAAAGWPVHLHISEQMAEVEDCVAHHSARPIDWLLQHVPVDARWNLVHATQATAAELAALRATGASIVLCPSTEANLGDGVFELPAWLAASGRWSIGSDSHVTRSWQEELRLLEYSQRFLRRRRNVAAAAALSESTAGALLHGAVEGGSAAAGLPLGGLAVGQRADFGVIDTASPALAGVPGSHLLDAFVFSSPEARFSRVFVAGMQPEPVAAGPAFRAAMTALWA